MAPTVDPSRGALRIALGTGLLLCAGLLLVRASGPWPGDAIVWPAAVAAVGGLLIWSSPHSRPRARRGWAAHRPHEMLSRRPPSSVRTLGRPEVSRGGLGVVLVLGAGFAFLWANGGVRPAGEAALAGLAVLIALALIFAPAWRRLARSLAAERSERIRSQERADVGAHLHDSVLQTLALIQRNADDPRQVATLARQQERELRAWLTGRDPARRGESVAAALEAAAAEVEAGAGGSVEGVAVGERALDGRAAAVVAAREAMLNAVKFAGESTVSVYAELSEERVQVFIRDRGNGFDPAAVLPERRGVRESIVGRMRRAGGSAVVRSAPGKATEVEITIDGRGRS